MSRFRSCSCELRRKIERCGPESTVGARARFHASGPAHIGGLGSLANRALGFSKILPPRF